jgi:hypothetical protein
MMRREFSSLRQVQGFSSLRSAAASTEPLKTMSRLNGSMPPQLS